MAKTWNITTDVNMTCESFPTQPIFKTGTLRFFLYHYMFPVNVSLGIIGNIVTFLVLISPCFRSKSAGLLAVMTISDLLFILCRIGQSLATFDVFAYADWFRSAYYATKIPLIAAANWFSFTSIWIAVAVTVERSMAIWRPFRSCESWGLVRICLLVFGIFFVGFCLTYYPNLFFTFIPQSCETIPLLNGSVLLSFTGSMSEPADTDWIVIFSSAMTFVNTFLMFIIPMMILTFMNALLLVTLQRTRNELRVLGRSNSTNAAKKQERKVTALVIVIVGSFLLFNALSAIVALMRATGNLKKSDLNGILIDVSNYLVLLGKTLNFLLYCLASERFRKHLSSKARASVQCLRTALRPTPQRSGVEVEMQEEQITFLPCTASGHPQQSTFV